MSAHTPGPWVKSGPYRIVGGGKCLSIDGGGITVATVGANDEDLAPAHADANLIAAAPDLLAALIDLMECDVKMSGGDAHVCRNAAREAIAKAEGKTS